MVALTAFSQLEYMLTYKIRKYSRYTSYITHASHQTRGTHEKQHTQKTAYHLTGMLSVCCASSPEMRACGIVAWHIGPACGNFGNKSMLFNMTSHEQQRPRTRTERQRQQHGVKFFHRHLTPTYTTWKWDWAASRSYSCVPGEWKRNVHVPIYYQQPSLFSLYLPFVHPHTAQSRMPHCNWGAAAALEQKPRIVANTGKSPNSVSWLEMRCRRCGTGFCSIAWECHIYTRSMRFGG